jgi:hypothetical protein
MGVKLETVRGRDKRLGSKNTQVAFMSGLQTRLGVDTEYLPVIMMLRSLCSARIVMAPLEAPRPMLPTHVGGKWRRKCASHRLSHAANAFISALHRLPAVKHDANRAVICVPKCLN